MSHPIGIVAFSLSPDPRLAVRAAKDLGFSGVQFDISQPAAPSPWLHDLDRSGQREFVKLLAGVNLRLLSLATTAGRRGFSPGADVDRALAHLDKSLRVTADLGKTAGLPIPLCLDVGPLPPPPPVPVIPPKPVDPTLLGLIILPPPSATPPPPPPQDFPADPAFEAQLDAALIELGRMADRYSVQVAFRSDLGSLPALHRALGAARCPLFALDLDPVAILREPLWTLESTLAHFTGRIIHVRARDALKGSAGRTQPAPIGNGHTPWPTLLRLLDDASFHGPLLIDPTELQDRPTAATAALSYLTSLTTPRP